MDLKISTRLTLEELERVYFAFVWKENDFNNARTARTLGISLKAFRSRLIQFGFNRKKDGKHWVLPADVYSKVEMLISTHSLSE